jgi:lipoprotein-anchoring transpeptidase ErfK/SrfK
VKRLSIAALFSAGLVALGGLGSGPAAADEPAAIPVGVTIGGLDVGGLSTEAATAAVEQAFQAPLVLHLGTTEITVTPDVLGAVPVIDKAVERALAAAPGTAISLGVTVNGGTADFVSKLAQRFNRPAVDAKLYLRQLRPSLTRERPGLKLGQRKAIHDINVQLAAVVREPVTLVQDRVRPRITRRNFGPVIVIRRQANRLFFYEGTQYRRNFPVATGQTQYPTPLGRFKIVVKWKNPWWYPPSSPWAQGQKPIPPGPQNPLGTRWLGLSAPGVGIHGTPSDASIGYSVSHGCIRMHIPEAEWLFNHVDVGTTVFIVAA